MNSIELKNILIYKISEINDIAFLKALKTIIDSRSEQKVISITPEQNADIDESINDYKKGLVIDNETLDKEFKKWESVK